MHFVKITDNRNKVYDREGGTLIGHIYTVGDHIFADPLIGGRPVIRVDELSHAVSYFHLLLKAYADELTNKIQKKSNFYPPRGRGHYERGARREDESGSLSLH